MLGYDAELKKLQAELDNQQRNQQSLISKIIAMNGVENMSQMIER